MAIADLTSDGTPDIVVANTGDNSVSVLLGNGDGTFQPQVTYDTGEAPISVAVADLNGDGTLDIVAANFGNSSVSVLLGNGDGTFQPQVSYATGTNPSSVAIADVNGDGIPDIVVANTSDNTVGVLPGNGDGTFQPQATFATGSIPSSVAVTDVNGDGKADLVVANFGDNTVGVLENNSNGSFAGQVFSGDFTDQVYTLVEPTVTTAAGSPNPSTYGQSVTFTATVTAGDNPVTSGTVTFSEGTNVLASSVPLNSNGLASFSISTLSAAASTQLITATYNGSSAIDYTSFETSSAIASQTVNPAPVTVSGITASDKVYDGTTTASIDTSSAALVGVLVGDSVTLDLSDATGSFINKNVGTAVLVSIAGLALAGADAQDYTVVQPTTTANITPLTLTFSATGVNKVYDGTTSATVTLSDDRVPGDVFTDGYSSATFSGQNPGNFQLITVNGMSIAGPDAGNYTVFDAATTAFANITPRPLTVTATGANKVYDGTTTVTVTLSDNRIAGDVLSDADTSASFANKNVATGKIVTVSGISISGADLADYTLVDITATTTANITPRSLTASATGVNKVYDGTTAATVTFADNRLAGDVFTETDTSATFANKNVGTGKTVSVSGITITGTDAGNYTLASTTFTTSANITPRTLTVSASGVNKIYDGTTTATVVLSDNRVAGDVLTDADISATFTAKNVGTGLSVAVAGITVIGADAGNYTLGKTTATTTANITPRTLTVSATGVNKVYDGTTVAAVILTDNRVAGDVFTDADISATFSDKNVGTGKTVSVSGITLTGADAGNYTLAVTTASTTANITSRALTVTATGVNKVYDGTTTATVILSDNRVAGDVFTVADNSASFPAKNVGTGLSVAVAGITVTGADAGNYTLASTSTTTSANITPRTLTVGATGVNKVYDGTTAATVILSDSRVAGDVFTDADISATFAAKTVVTGNTVTVAGITITGGDAGNYTLASTTATTTANITPRTLTVSATGLNKVYDGTTVATVSLTDNRVAGDVFTDADTSASFTDKNVGTGKSVTVAGITITGADAGNYTLASTAATTTANITPLALTVSATAVNKVYDATPAATVVLADNRVAGDVFTDADTSATFSDKNVGTDKTVSVSGIAITGTDAGNYTLAGTTLTTSANITPRTLTVAPPASTKPTTAPPPPPSALSDNRVAGDVLTDGDTSATFTAKNVGTGLSAAVAGITVTGADAGNYTLASTTATTTANITPRTLTVSATGLNKVYDGTTVATVTLTDNRVAGDVFTDAENSASFTDKNIGTGKSVTVAGITISGNDAGNYTLASSTATTTANITPRALTVSATAANKVYNGTTTASITLSDNRVAGDVFTDADAAATFSDKNVGTGKSATVSGIAITGQDAGNYTLASTTATTTANITPLALTVSASGLSKVYDGTTAATVTLGDNRVPGDVFTDADTSATFTDKNVGTGKVVTVAGITITGTDAGNYSLASTSATTTANITPRALTVSATGVNKVYDGTATATVTCADNRVAGDVFTDAENSASFTDKNVGTGKAVSVTGITITGTDAANYSIVSTTATTTANITPRAATGQRTPASTRSTTEPPSRRSLSPTTASRAMSSPMATPRPPSPTRTWARASQSPWPASRSPALTPVTIPWPAPRPRPLQASRHGR